MEIGNVVKSVAGRDKGRFYVVVSLVSGYVFIADGKFHKLETPKKKNPAHLRKTNDRLDMEKIFGNCGLKKALEKYNENV